MTPQIKATVKEWLNKYSLVLPYVLEVGAMDVNGSVRADFIRAGTEKYIGLDREPGKGVDVIGEVRDILDEFDAVVCLEVLEHDPRFWETLAHIRRRVKDGGYFFVSTPTIGFPYHPYPKDHYRFTKDAFNDIILDGYEILELKTVKDDDGNPGIIALGRRVKNNEHNQNGDNN